MTARTWLYQRLVDNVPSVAGRVYAKKSMTSSVEEHPYIVYKLGNSTGEAFSETVDVDRQFIQIFVHDYSDGETADYLVIDSVLAEIRAALHQASSAEDGVIAVPYLETSQDLNDETLNTVMRYIRFQLILKENQDG